MAEKKFARTLVTAALPYANGPKHIGHLAGAYLPADIYVRHKRLKGEEVAFICGSDEHGAAITIQAIKEKTTPRAIVDHYHELLKTCFHELGIEFDIYHRTSDPLHHETARDFFTTLYNKGWLKEDFSEQYYDEEAGVFLADRYIKGTCPVCGHPDAYGDQCEKCGSSLSPKELICPHSTLSGSRPVLKPTKHWYLPLNEFEPWLRDWILKTHEKDWKPTVYGQCKSWIDSGLQPRAVTRDLDWGVQVPLEEAKGKVLYVWFDAPIGYVSATKQWALDKGENWEKWWKSDDTRLIHFIGKDNIVFHCIIFPAMLKAYGGFILPDNVPANEFLNLEGDKMSTSRGWSVEMQQYLADFPGKPDALRYYLCSNMPENKDAEFTWKDFQARFNNELADILGNFVNRAAVLTHKFCGGKIPPAGSFGEGEKEILEALKTIPGLVSEHLEQFRFKAALAEAMNLARAGNKYMADTEPWKTVKTDMARTHTILNLSLQVVGNLSVLMEPFLPFTAKKIRQLLHTEGKNWNDLGRTNLIPEGMELDVFPILFQKIEDSMIENQLEKLHGQQKPEAVPAQPSIPIKPDVSFEQFQAMDIRVATILEAEKVQGADKLLKLKLDLGNGYHRTVVSGIALHYEPENIIGQQVSYLANLQPRKLRGIVSEGLILMAEDPETGALRFVAPIPKAGEGATIK
jgi:methionyl-tRNA synthetase